MKSIKNKNPSEPVILLFVVNDLPFFLSHRLPLAIAAKNSGYEVHVATPPSVGEEILKSHGLVFHPVDIYRKSLNPFRELSTLFSLYRLYKQVQPNLIHQVTIKPVLYGGIAARLAGVPAIVNAISGLGYVFVEGGMIRNMLRYLILKIYRYSHKHKNICVIFQNPDDLKVFLNSKIISEKQTCTIKGAGVSMDEYSPQPEPCEPITVTLASRMLWEKGVGDFVAAAKILKKSGVACRCVLVGDADPGNPNSISSEQLGVWKEEGAVEWAGLQHDIAAIFACSHIVVLPSYYGEGMPKVLIEAAACGRPIITTDSPGCREVVEDGLNGILVPVRDPQAIAAAIKRLIDDPEKRRLMGAEGRKKAKSEFSLELVVGQTMQIYSELIK